MNFQILAFSSSFVGHLKECRVVTLMPVMDGVLQIFQYLRGSCALGCIHILHQILDTRIDTEPSFSWVKVFQLVGLNERYGDGRDDNG